MSPTTPAVPAETIENLAQKIAGRDPIEVQSELIQTLRHATLALSPEQTVQAEAPGKWSIAEVIQHLADAELAYGWRIRMLLSHDNPALQGFDQDLWAKALDYRSVTLDDALSQLEPLRTANLRLLRKQDDAALDRTGLHSEAGLVSVRMILYILANHDQVHVRQIARIKKAIGA